MTFERSLFTAGNTHSEIVQTFCGQGFLPALCIGIQRVTSVDHDIAGFEMGQQLIDDRVYRSASLDHDHHFTWFCEAAGKLLNGASCRNTFSSTAPDRKLLPNVRSPIVNRNGKTFALHIENKIFAHDSKADESDI